MVRNIFISYAKEDISVADTICANLENRGLRCWIAPRDIAYGERDATAIIHAIENAKVVVVVFSRSSDQSAHVRTEIERAFNQGKIIIPFRIENIEPSDEIQYFIGSRQWLDTFSGSLEGHTIRLADIIEKYLTGDTEFRETQEKPSSKGKQYKTISKGDFQNKIAPVRFRFISYCIDFGIGVVIGFLFLMGAIDVIPIVIGQESFNHLWYLSGYGGQVTPFSKWVQGILMLAGIITWLIVIDSSRSRSPGKALLGLDIHWPPDTMNFHKRKIIRSLVKNFPLFALFFLGFLIDEIIAFYIFLVLCAIWIIPIIFTSDSQSFHDRVSGTCVLLIKYRNWVKV